MSSAVRVFERDNGADLGRRIWEYITSDWSDVEETLTRAELFTRLYQIQDEERDRYCAEGSTGRERSPVYDAESTAVMEQLIRTYTR